MSDLRRGNRRSFSPGDSGLAALESRLLLSTAKVTAAMNGNHPGKIQSNVANAGKVARVRDVDGEIYEVRVIGRGFVRGRPESNGRVGLTLQSTNSESVVTVEPLLRSLPKNSAHTYPSHPNKGDNLLHIGSINVTSGRLNQFLAFKTADLSGRFMAASNSPVDRVAFYAFLPGATVRVGNDLNTLNSFTDMTLGGSGGIITGRDLNWMSVGGNLTIGAGSTVLVGRDLGLNAQPAKGTDTGGRGGLVGGNVTIEPGGSFTITRSLQATYLVNGNFDGFSRLSVAFGGNNFIVRGSATP